MCAAWGWSSDKVVRTFLDRLEMDGRIVRASGQQEGQTQALITICKYDEYQFGDAVEVQASGQQEGQALGQPRANQGPEYEEGLRKNKKSTARKRAAGPLEFEKWYATYPNKKSPKAAARAYAKVIASGEISEADLLARTETFAASWARQPKEQRRFIPYPASWLNDGSYADELEPTSGKSSAAPPADPANFTNERWRQCLSLYDRTHQWGEHWGPPPRAEGCFVPNELLPPIDRGVNENQPPIFSGTA
jgi:hypothetical protein